REAQQFHRRTFREKCDRGKIPTQYPEEIKLPMREIDYPIAIEIELKLRIPKIPDSMNCPEAAGDIRPRGFDTMQVASESILRESVAIRVRAEAETDVVSRHAVARDFVLVALVERKPHCVFADLILLEPTAIGRLENQAISAKASVIYESV